MDEFEHGLAGAFLRLVDDIQGDVDGIAVAHRVASEHPRRRTHAGSRGMTAVPRLAWILLLALLLAAIGSAALLAGARRAVLPAVTTDKDAGTLLLNAGSITVTANSTTGSFADTATVTGVATPATGMGPGGSSAWRCPPCSFMARAARCRSRHRA